MNFNTFLRHLREGCKNVFRNGWMSIASITSIVVSLFVLGVFILLVVNVNQLADDVDSTVEIRTYLNLDVDEKMRETINTEIGLMPEVSKVTFISKEQGLLEFSEGLGEDGKALLEGFDNDNNPLPDTLVVEVIEAKTVPQVADKISALNEVHPESPIMKVNYGEGAVEKLFKITRAVRNIGFIFVAVLGVMSMFLISNTIRVTILARRREIGIQKLVGATNSFIRWPFFIEGALIGGIGSLATVGILILGYDQLIQAISKDITLGLTLVPLADIWLLISTLLLAIGILIGIWGSTVSIRKFLKV
ncbi:permease-like cell division protein FtsX [Paenibacillus crassostreae]|uniref:Cell division protein FtsX n=1 Tax=Paenibacillus crassostreae TaxID=1763538 RepID=A0A167CX79_9BACL|nr:permease-like cell division protein FtsX [Paenibacillus crassostreae]AOZ93271.1 cell division protein FtsX [Paenibacillus crassostreae]OAB73681.1 cell division protein FtsX [Paenibacillus crassostreae]